MSKIPVALGTSVELADFNHPQAGSWSTVLTEQKVSVCDERRHGSTADWAPRIDIGHLDGLSYFWYGYGLHTKDSEVWRIVTTPNASWIPQPCIRYRDVSLRQDGFLGHEDPVFWPQLYSETHPYLACISIKSEPDSDGDFLRGGITAETVEFTDPITAYPRKCRLSASHSNRCSAVWGRVKSAVTHFTAKHGTHHHKRLDVIASQIGLACSSITRLEGVFLEVRLRFALLCRLFVELEAYCRYHELCGSHEFSMVAQPVDEALVGTITTEEAVCYRFHRMGIPVWLVRRLVSNHGTPCRLVTERLPCNPESRKIWPHNEKIVVARVPNVHPVYEGPFEDPSYLERIGEWVRNFFRTELGVKHPLYPFVLSYQRKPRSTGVSNAGGSKKRKAPTIDDGAVGKKNKKRQALTGAYSDGESTICDSITSRQSRPSRRMSRQKV